MVYCLESGLNTQKIFIMNKTFTSSGLVSFMVGMELYNDIDVTSGLKCVCTRRMYCVTFRSGTFLNLS